MSFPDGFISAVQNIPTGGGGSTLITKSITENGTYDASDDSADGYSEVTVNVPQTTSPFVKLGTYTIDSDFQDTALVLCQTVLANYLNANAIAYILICNNNANTSGYRADAVILMSSATTVADLANNPSGAAWKNYYGSIGSLGGTVRASQGTTIDIYRALHA